MSDLPYPRPFPYKAWKGWENEGEEMREAYRQHLADAMTYGTSGGVTQKKIKPQKVSKPTGLK